jgi:hypothetical protein
VASAAVKALRDEDALRGVPTQADFNAMIRKRRREVRQATEDLASGKINIHQWADRFDASLLSGHSRAWHLGRRLAGDLRGFGTDDMLAGRAAKDKDSKFLNQFVQDIVDRDPRYVEQSGQIRANAVINRANLYIGRMRASAAESFVGACKDDELFDWILGATEQHCEDCPALAALSPFTKSTLSTYPGEGDTECLGNCKCYLRRRSDRLTTFKASDHTEGAALSQTSEPVPVSDALDNQLGYPLSARVNEAIALIDKAHSDGTLPETMVYGIIDTPELGGYFDPVNLEIAINVFGPGPMGTFIHETGHLLDLFAIGKNGRPASARSRKLKPFRDAVKSTESFKRIQDIKAGATITVSDQLIEADDDMRKHAEYLDKWEEYWARAYFQFILRRTNDPRLSAEASNLLNSSYQKVFLAQWDGKDFDAVEKAIEELFVSLGWMLP